MSLSKDQLAQLLASLTVERTRLAWLYAEAYRLEREGRRHTCDRLRIVESVMQTCLASMRKKARLCVIDEEGLQKLQTEHGIARDWVVTGDIEALRQGILDYSSRMQDWS